MAVRDLIYAITFLKPSNLELFIFELYYTRYIATFSNLYACRNIYSFGLINSLSFNVKEIGILLIGL